MLSLKENHLFFSFPEIHSDAFCTIDFQRTLRLPDDNKNYHLPPGLGEFPLVHTEDYSETTPPHWQKFGGVMLPMYQSEAMWISFNSPNGYPFAVKIATGKINAVTGELWKNELRAYPQDYLAIPNQPWLDGFHTADNMVRQFVAMPLGQGFSAEEQLTGKTEFGGIQIIVYPMKAKYYQQKLAEEVKRQPLTQKKKEENEQIDIKFSLSASSMGISPGGRIKQKIYDDPHDLNAYETAISNRCFVQIVNSEQWQQITGSLPPLKPLSAKEYANEGLPWFDYYSEAEVLSAGNILSKLKGIASSWLDKTGKPMKNNNTIKTQKIININKKNDVNDGNW